MTQLPVEIAQRLAHEGDRQAAVEALLAASDDAVAMAELAMWYLRGDIIPRDVVRAREFLRRAVEIGHVDAALKEVALTANGSGAPSDWQGAMELLSVAAVNDPLASQHLQLLQLLKLDADGNPQVLPIGQEVVAGSGVQLWHDFLSPYERGFIAQEARPLLEPSMVHDPKTGRLMAHPVRTSLAAQLGPTHEALPIQAITRRIAAVTSTHWTQGESLTVLQYGPGQEYKEHLDTLPFESNQRMGTMLLYLNDSYEAGETYFPTLGLSIKGKAGDALFFPTLLADGSPNKAMRHAGRPVLRGTKWVATRWIRQEPLNPWTVSQQRQP